MNLFIYNILNIFLYFISSLNVKISLIYFKWQIKMTTTTMPCYDEVTKSLKSLKALTEASESHGLLCALFCVGAEIRKSAWIDSMLTDHVQDGDIMIKHAVKILGDMFDETSIQYDSDFFKFDLLLPIDDTPFYHRIGALALWSQGFLAGIGLMGISLDSGYSAEVKEAIADLSKIARLQYDDEMDGDDDDEAAYTELVEYAKVASLLLHSECEIVKKQNA